MDLLEAMPGGSVVAVRDVALLTLAGQLAMKFQGELAFKGGFVLRPRRRAPRQPGRRRGRVILPPSTSSTQTRLLRPFATRASTTSFGSGPRRLRLTPPRAWTLTTSMSSARTSPKARCRSR